MLYREIPSDIMQRKCCGLSPVGKKEPRGCFITPPSWWGGEENRKKKAKLTGWYKDSLTEQQRRRTITAIILIIRIYKARNYTVQYSHCPMPRLLPSSDCPPLARFPT